MSISVTILGISRQLRRARNLTSSIWKPGGSLKHSNNKGALVCISHSRAISIIGCTVLLLENRDLTELHELFPKCDCSTTGRCRHLPFTGDNSKASIELLASKEKGWYECSLGNSFFWVIFVFSIPMYTCVEVKRCLYREDTCLWRRQEDGEMTTEMIMSL